MKRVLVFLMLVSISSLSFSGEDTKKPSRESPDTMDIVAFEASYAAAAVVAAAKPKTYAWVAGITLPVLSFSMSGPPKTKKDLLIDLYYEALIFSNLVMADRMSKTNIFITNFIGLSAPFVADVYVSRKNGSTDKEVRLILQGREAALQYTRRF